MNHHPARETLRRLDDLAAAERDSVLDHAAVCERCREALVADDPARIFALLGRRGVPESVLDDLSAGVSDAIDSGRMPRGIGVSRRTRAVGAWAAAVLLAIGLVWVTDRPTPRSPDRGPVSEKELNATPRATVAVLESPGEAQVVDLALGETQVVMIFDREMDL